MNSYRRLPHAYPQGRWLFVTWHLYGSFRHAQFPPPHGSTAGQAFVWMDRQLDRIRTGPRFLAQEPVARVVVGALQHGVELGHYELGAWVVMVNHVHALVLPKIPPSQIMKSLKGFTAHEVNRILGRTGEPFWQKESYDHWVRDEAEHRRIAAYIENNPVAAGLAVQAEDYPWSSAHQRSAGAGSEPSVGTSADAAR